MIDVDECKRLEYDFEMKNFCEKDSRHVATCKNVCGNFTCACENTNETVIDIFDPTKCYKSKLKLHLKKRKRLTFFCNQENEKRDFTLYLQIERLKTNLFEKNLDITVESCETNQPLQIKKFKFQTELTELDDFLTSISHENWFPIVIYNTNWSSIEFVCKIQVDIISIINSDTSFQQVRILYN